MNPVGPDFFEPYDTLMDAILDPTFELPDSSFKDLYDSLCVTYYTPTLSTYCFIRHHLASFVPLHLDFGPPCHSFCCYQPTKLSSCSVATESFDLLTSQQFIDLSVAAREKFAQVRTFVCMQVYWHECIHL